MVEFLFLCVYDLLKKSKFLCSWQRHFLLFIFCLLQQRMGRLGWRWSNVITLFVLYENQQRCLSNSTTYEGIDVLTFFFLSLGSIKLSLKWYTFAKCYFCQLASPIYCILEINGCLFWVLLSFSFQNYNYNYF